MQHQNKNRSNQKYFQKFKRYWYVETYTEAY